MGNRDQPIIAGASHRDPLGRLLRTEHGVFRFVRTGGIGSWRALNAVRSSLATARVDIITGRVLDANEIQRTAEIDPSFAALLSDESWEAVLVHPTLPFVTFAEEWTPGMLASAGHATLDIAIALAERGWRLKDAATGNIVFDGTQAVFVDALSAERTPPGARVWPAFAQFMQSFVFPLRATGLGLMTVRRAFSSGIDGISVTEMASALRWRKWIPPYFLHVGVTNALHRRADNAWRTTTSSDRDSAPSTKHDPTTGLLRHLRKVLRAATPRSESRSAWIDYETITHDSSYHDRKRQLVVRWCAENAVTSALDIGANEGAVSLGLAATGLRVVAAERDEVVADRMWYRAAAVNARVTPVVIDITDPTPARGWRQRERPAFLDRAGRSFDAVIALAVLHHLGVASAAPVEDILALLRGFSTRLLVVEHIDPTDEMFIKIVRGRDHLFGLSTAERFAKAASSMFTIREREHLTPTRTLYLLERR